MVGDHGAIFSPQAPTDLGDDRAATRLYSWDATRATSGNKCQTTFALRFLSAQVFHGFECAPGVPVLYESGVIWMNLDESGVIWMDLSWPEQVPLKET